MLYQKIKFDEKDENAYLEIYIAEKAGDFVRNPILILPGGGYSGVCAEREGEPIAHAFMPYGYNAFVLHYTVKEKPFPSHLIQVSKAIKHIKENSEKYNIDADKLFVIGFSAGGHLAATIGTMWDKKEIYDEIEMPFGYNKPKGVMLIYPVISAKHHGFSFNNLLMDKNPSEEQLKSVSVENAVDEKSCPAFILHTSNDEVVNVKNSLVFAEALASNNIKFEMHIYPDGPHGVALADKITKCGVEKWENPSIAKWVENAVKWAESIN